MDIVTIVQILESTLRLATPLLFACLAGIISERAGIFDIGLEGKLLISAFFSAAFAFYTGSAWLGLLVGILSSVIFSVIHGIASITFRGNQLISGVAINFLAAGMTVVIAQSWFQQGGRTPPLSGDSRFGRLDLPGAEAVRDVPILGEIYGQILNGHSILVYIGLLCVPLVWYILYRTRFGLRLRAVGENPAAVDTAGVSVVKMRFAAILIAGVLCGIGGAYLSTSLAAGFVKDMSAGRGFIALAAMIFAKWRPWQGLGAVLLFGMLEAIGNRFPNLDLGFITLPNQFMTALPYILTVVILAGFVGKAIGPRAGGEPYVKER
ncbi:ABC transporter permease [Pararhodobacter sp.]|uniref:ABC transporter permease n=1 Tax=Pararhodobacter sp. TaxID=2127056 RepID=UPI002AFE59E3|nr:ABC transporter permease [Pararhodobacter sp.]